MNKDSKDAPGARIEPAVLKLGSDQGQPTSAPRVLVVDDNPLNAKLVLAQLELAGYEGTYVESGEAALEALEAGAFSIVLMDCKMSGMDGCATTREIRRREHSERHTPVVGLSSNTAKSARAECLEAGMDGYIGRPVTTIKLIEQLRQISTPNESASTSGKIAAAPEDVQGHEADTIDANTLAELASFPGEDGGLLIELRDMFLLNLPAMLQDLQIVGASSAELAGYAHHLKSASTTIGGKRLAALCQTVEEICQGDDLSSLESLLVEVYEEAVRLAEKLKEIPLS